MIGTAQVERFREIIGQVMGLHIDEGKSVLAADLATRRAALAGRDLPAYLHDFAAGQLPGEVAALAQELTVGETYFFRHLDQFKAFAEICLPARLGVQAGSRSLRILSAGCASGEEAYTLAILAKGLADSTWNVSIQGIDINPDMIAKATKARYSAWSLRETPTEIQSRWFRMDGTQAVLDESIRTAVRFSERNLAAADAGFWQAEAYDIIFCRNMLMYFTAEEARKTVERLAASLSPGGYLFLGHAETLRGLSNDFHLCHTHNTFYYQRRSSHQHAGKAALHSPAAATPSDTQLAAALAQSGSWVEAIGRATTRIRSLTATAAETAMPAATVDARAELAVAFDLLREERFTDALRLMDTLPQALARDPDALLLRAVLLVHGGRSPAAEEACRRLLDIDEFNAGAHYVLALCHEEANDRSTAADHDRMAIYLDHSFAMPHLHLGLLGKKNGARGEAAHEFAQALPLLEREDAARLLLFGGGFNRTTLVALCRAELTGHGARS